MLLEHPEKLSTGESAEGVAVPRSRPTSPQTEPRHREAPPKQLADIWPPRPGEAPGARAAAGTTSGDVRETSAPDRSPESAAFARGLKGKLLDRLKPEVEALRTAIADGEAVYDGWRWLFGNEEEKPSAWDAIVLMEKPKNRTEFIGMVRRYAIEEAALHYLRKTPAVNEELLDFARENCRIALRERIIPAAKNLMDAVRREIDTEEAAIAREKQSLIKSFTAKLGLSSRATVPADAAIVALRESVGNVEADVRRMLDAPRGSRHPKMLDVCRPILAWLNR